MAASSIDFEPYGDVVVVDESPQTRTYEEGIALHRRAYQNLKHVFAKVHCMIKPPLQTIYDGTATADCAPEEFQLTKLFKHFNDIARAGFFAQPHLGTDMNGLLILYGMGKSRCFILTLDHVRFNLFLIVYIWVTIVVGKEADFEQYYPSYDMRFSYLMAWLESMDPDNDFSSRMEFLNSWNASDHDLTCVVNNDRGKIKEALKKLENFLPPLQGDPATFIAQCRMKIITPAEFHRVGPAMALNCSPVLSIAQS